MKRGHIVLIAALALGILVYLGSRLMVRTPGHAHASHSFVGENGNLLPELDWLRQSLHLSDTQFEKVKALHLAYRPKCDELCERVRKSDEVVLAAAKQGALSEALTAALRQRADLLLECQQAMLAHVHETAACMDAAQAARYLEIVLPYVLGMNSACSGSHHSM